MKENKAVNNEKDLELALSQEKIIFVTKARTENPKNGQLIKPSQHFINTDRITTTQNSLFLVNKILSSDNPIGLDTEFSSSVFYMQNLLLISFNIDEMMFVVDCTTVDFKELFKGSLNKQYVAHNAQAEYFVLKTNGVELRNFYDTMIVEQRLVAGSGKKNSLAEVWERKGRITNGNIYRKVKQISKLTRKKFSGADNDFVFDEEHVLYSATDVIAILHIKENQERLIKKYNMEFLLYDIEFPLIPILADASLLGFKLNEDKWSKIYDKNILKCYELEVQLDKEVNRLIKKHDLLNKAVKEKINFRIPYTNHLRPRPQINYQTDLFGNDVKTVKSKLNNSKFINYGSSNQVLNIFRMLGAPVPSYYRYQEDRDVPSAGAPILQQYLIDNLKTELKEFIELLLEHKKLVKRINNYGERFLKYRIHANSGKVKLGFKNPVTNNVHTVFKQCFTNNGRLSSGDEESGKYNAQNMVRENEYRECFGTDDGYYISTVDLSGAELVITAAKAKDVTMLEKGLKQDDLHSPLGQEAWRKVFKHRSKKIEDKLTELVWGGDIINSYPKAQQLISKNEDLLNKAENLVITKKINSDLRTAFKNVNFAIIYGAKGSRVAKTMNISREEGEIVIRNHYEMIPNAMQLTDGYADFATKNGYIIHNTRTNSRRWFLAALDHRSTQSEIIAVQNEARNSPISGTQADMIKEAMVEIDKYIRANNIEAQLMGQVHDELIYRHKDPAFHDKIKEILIEVSNRYLEGFCEMGAEGHMGKTWKK